MQKADILGRIEDAGVISVVRAATPEKAKKVVEAVIAGGVKGIELTFTVPHADRAFYNQVSQLDPAN